MHRQPEPTTTSNSNSSTSDNSNSKSGAPTANVVGGRVKKNKNKQAARQAHHDEKTESWRRWEGREGAQHGRSHRLSVNRPQEKSSNSNHIERRTRGLVAL